MRRSLSFAVIALALAAPAARAQEVMPLDQVRPGMVGVGRTVFEGTKIEEFRVEIIGVLENVAPGRAHPRAPHGGPLEKTGVIAGMSGSPVLIDGKLVGAWPTASPSRRRRSAGSRPSTR